jgi:hypothetical protein
VRPWLALLLLGLAGCGGSASQETRYIGAVTPDGACGQASRGTLTTAKGRFTFAPSDGVLLVQGEVAADGALSGTLATTGADRKPFVMRLTGTADGAHVVARFVTPRCGYDVRLDKSDSRAFEVPYL